MESSLIQQSDLRLDYMKSLGISGTVWVRYDSLYDAGFIMFDDPKKRKTAAFFLNDDVAVLYDRETLDVVGIQIDDFLEKVTPEGLKNLLSTSPKKAQKRKSVEVDRSIVATSRASLSTLKIDGDGRIVDSIETRLAEPAVIEEY